MTTALLDPPRIEDPDQLTLDDYDPTPTAPDIPKNGGFRFSHFGWDVTRGETIAGEFDPFVKDVMDPLHQFQVVTQHQLPQTIYVNHPSWTAGSRRIGENSFPRGPAAPRYLVLDGLNGYHLVMRLSGGDAFDGQCRRNLKMAIVSAPPGTQAANVVALAKDSLNAHDGTEAKTGSADVGDKTSPIVDFGAMTVPG